MSLARDLARLEAQWDTRTTDRDAADRLELKRYFAVAGARLTEAGATIESERVSEAEFDAEASFNAARAALADAVRSGADDATMLTRWRATRVARIRRDLLEMCAGQNSATALDFEAGPASIRDRKDEVSDIDEVPQEVPSAMKELS